MKVKFVYESQLCWITERTIEVNENVSHSEIKDMFQDVLNVPYNKYECSYEVVGNGHIFNDHEMLAYTE